MTPPTQYYGAEIQNVQVHVNQNLISMTGNDKIVPFVFNQKVLSQTFTVKYNQSATLPFKLSTITVELDYEPILLQLGQGGPPIGDPYAYVKSNLPRNYFTNDKQIYKPNLQKTKAISNITTSIAGNLMEVTCVYSLVLSTPIVTIFAFERA